MNLHRIRLTLAFLLCAGAGGIWRSAVAAAESVVTNVPPHWAFQPLRSISPPVVADAGWARTIPDRFILAALQSHGLKPSPVADPRALLRRLSFDLRGLPPTPAELAEFLADPSPDAWNRWIERFLAEPAYGERWGRHWLDVAGYADSNGYFNADSDRPLAWKYRDYVIRSIQENKPFDRFIQEQIAGDELAGFVREGDVKPGSEDLLVATHFLRNPPDGTGESDGNPLELKVDRYTVLEGCVQLVGNAFLGLTLQCARCHDHKFEPVRQTEYYALQAILRPALDPVEWIKPQARTVGLASRAERTARTEAIAAFEREVKTLESAIAAVQVPFRRRWLEEALTRETGVDSKAVLQAFDTPEAQRSEAMKSLLKARTKGIVVEEIVLSRRFPDLKAALMPLRESLQRRAAMRPSPVEQVSLLSEPSSTPPVHHLLIRGNHASEGVEVGPGIPMSLGAPAAEFAGGVPTSGRRLALARWLTDSRHPLVARVWVNRVWKLHFGEGLVTTADNLGRSGAVPSHPELLDWLAVDFIRSGWSLKHLHRLVLNSAVWRQSSRLDSRSTEELAEVERARLVDGANRWLWHYPIRRLDAESLRDSMLAASGELDVRLGGAYTPIQVDAAGQIIIDESAPGARRRSLYLQQRRTQPIHFLEVFDGPQPNPVCIQRNPSTVALQSLSLLNSEFARNRARAMARRLVGPGGAPMDGAVRTAFELAIGRPPTPAESEASTAFLRSQAQVYAGATDAGIRVWSDFCQMLLAGNAAVYVE